MPKTDNQPDWNDCWRKMMQIAATKNARHVPGDMEPMFLESGEPWYMELGLDPQLLAE